MKSFRRGSKSAQSLISSVYRVCITLICINCCTHASFVHASSIVLLPASSIGRVSACVHCECIIHHAYTSIVAHACRAWRACVLFAWIGGIFGFVFACFFSLFLSSFLNTRVAKDNPSRQTWQKSGKKREKKKESIVAQIALLFASVSDVDSASVPPIMPTPITRTKSGFQRPHH